MSRAEQLRTAATRMREVGAAAMDGPWGVDDDGTSVYAAKVAPYGAPLVVSQVCEEDAEWIALVDPRLAGPLPDLLEAIAELLTVFPRLEWPHVDGEPCDDHACRILHLALAVADVLGGDA